MLHSLESWTAMDASIGYLIALPLALTLAFAFILLRLGNVFILRADISARGALSAARKRTATTYTPAAGRCVKSTAAELTQDTTIRSHHPWHRQVSQ